MLNETGQGAHIDSGRSGSHGFRSGSIVCQSGHRYTGILFGVFFQSSGRGIAVALCPKISDSMTPVLMDAYTATPIPRPNQQTIIIPGIIPIPKL